MGFEPMSCLVHSQVLCLLSYKHHLAENVGLDPTHGFPWLLFSKQAHYRSAKTPYNAVLDSNQCLLVTPGETTASPTTLLSTEGWI